MLMHITGTQRTILRMTLCKIAIEATMQFLK